MAQLKTSILREIEQEVHVPTDELHHSIVSRSLAKQHVKRSKPKLKRTRTRQRSRSKAKKIQTRSRSRSRARK